MKKISKNEPSCGGCASEDIREFASEVMRVYDAETCGCIRPYFFLGISRDDLKQIAHSCGCSCVLFLTFVTNHLNAENSDLHSWWSVGDKDYYVNICKVK